MDLARHNLTIKTEGERKYLYQGDKKISLACTLSDLSRVQNADGSPNMTLLDSLAACPVGLRYRGITREVAS